jgi:hypothetical protein
VGAGVLVAVGCGVSVGGLGSVVIGAGKVSVGKAGSMAFAHPLTRIKTNVITDIFTSDDMCNSWRKGSMCAVNRRLIGYYISLEEALDNCCGKKYIVKYKNYRNSRDKARIKA